MDRTATGIRLSRARRRRSGSRCRRNNHNTVRRCLVQTSKNDVQPHEARGVDFFGRLRRLQVYPEPDVPGISSDPGRVGGFLLELARLPSAPCLRLLHEPIPNRARGASAQVQVSREVRRL